MTAGVYYYVIGVIMSNTWFTSDLHEGHRNIGKFRKIPEEFLTASKEHSEDGEVNSTIANSLWIDAYWRKLVKKRDTVYCLGDNAFTEWGVDQIAARPGTKVQFGGNHDDLPIQSYLRAFSNVRGCKKQSKIGWLSHFPLHPIELRGHFSIHGHVHYQTIPDWRYVNVCCDNLFEEIGRPLISLDEIKELLEKRRQTEEVVY